LTVYTCNCCKNDRNRELFIEQVAVRVRPSSPSMFKFNVNHDTVLLHLHAIISHYLYNRPRPRLHPTYSWFALLTTLFQRKKVDYKMWTY